MEHTEVELPALFFRLVYRWRWLIILAGAWGAHLAIRWRMPAMTWGAWSLAWLLLSVGMTGLGAAMVTLPQSASVGVLASAGAVLAAMLIVPWQEQPRRHWRWSTKASWLGRGVFGVLVAGLLVGILHEFFLIVFRIN